MIFLVLVNPVCRGTGTVDSTASSVDVLFEVSVSIKKLYLLKFNGLIS